jgi:hypothetical protein
MESAETSHFEPELKAGPEIILIQPIDKTDARYKQYFESYSSSPFEQMHFDNLINFNQNGTFLYEISPEDKKLAHIIWFNNNPDNILPLHEIIPAEDWNELISQPELINRVNNILMESFSQALNFYKWADAPKGFVIEQSKKFGLEAGNFAGIRISFPYIKPLFNAIKNNDQEKIKIDKKHITASIIHELTHCERDDGIISQVPAEIASHIAQFIFDPHDNEIFNEQIARSLEQIEKRLNSQENSNWLNLYDKDIYGALLIIAEKLAEQNQTIKSAIEADGDPYKISTLKILGTLIGESDQEYLKETILPAAMKLTGAELLQIIKDIESKNGAQQDAMEMG